MVGKEGVGEGEILINMCHLLIMLMLILHKEPRCFYVNNIET